MVLPLLAGLAPFAPLIGGVVSGLGQLFAPKPKPASLDLVAMRREAERAGFNPLAVLRAGGAMGFTNAPADYRFSNALGTLGAGISNWNYDPTSLSRGVVELEIAKKTLANMNNKAPANMSFAVPKVAAAAGKPVTMAMPFGWPSITVANPELAEEAQTHFGDWMEGLIGIPNFIDSVAMSITGHNPRTHKAPGSPLTGETFDQFQLRMKKAPLHITVRGGAN